MSRLLVHTLALAALASVANAYPRVPQVPVSGTALATFFASQGQAIDPATDQVEGRTFAFLNVGIPVAFTFNVRAGLGNASLCAYNVNEPNSPLFTIFPGSASPGSFTSVTYGDNPNRLISNLFDAQGALQGTTSYLGVDPFATGLAVVGPGGARYSEDTRNPGGLARVLYFAGTGAQAYNVWLCAEDSESGTGDFADHVFLLEWFAPVGTKRTTWGRVRELYR